MWPDSGDPPDQVTPGAGYVLVVGRDAVARVQLERILGEAGFEVMNADEDEVLAACDLNPPRLAVADVPDAAEPPVGGRMLQRLASHPALQGVPIIALAPYSGLRGVAGAVVDGAAACLAKPVEPLALAAAAARLAEWSPPPPEADSRRHRRRPLLLEVEVTEPESGRRTAGQIVEASSAGCRLELPLLLEPGRKVRLVLCAGQRATQLALGGEVRWAQTRDDGRGAAGVRFNGSTRLVAARVLGLLDES